MTVGIVGGSEELDAGPGELDLDALDLAVVDHAEDAELTRLQATFEASPWAGLQPEEVEIEIHLVLGDNIVVCKIDAVFRRGEAPREVGPADDLSFLLRS